MTILMGAVPYLLVTAVMAPLVAAVLLGLRDLLGAPRSESLAASVIALGLFGTVVSDIGLVAAWPRLPAIHDVEYGPWLAVGSYEIPLTLRVDALGLAFAALTATLTVVVTRFSRTYLHKEPGFLRFHLLLAMFCGGSHLVAFAGALDLMFAGWELMGFSSALFIGFFHERGEPTRSSVRAFATYRLCDAGFLLATVMTHEIVGSTRLSRLAASPAMTVTEDSIIAALFLISAMGKSAQLPFSGWLPRAMEGPTPSSALFYGSISLHAGLFLLLRVWTTVVAAPVVQVAAVAIGLSTAAYGTLAARANTDAKGNLAHATLAQVGLILAEVALGFTTLATCHLVGHAMLRVWQYLRAPNTIHDAHRLGVPHRTPSRLASLSPLWAARLHAAALHRLRLDDLVDGMLLPVWRLASWLDNLDRRYRGAVSVDGPASPEAVRGAP